jgi:hypothetical protein
MNARSKLTQTVRRVNSIELQDNYEIVCCDNKDSLNSISITLRYNTDTTSYKHIHYDSFTSYAAAIRHTKTIAGLLMRLGYNGLLKCK